MDHGLEYIEDPDEVAFFQRRSRGIYIRTFLTTKRKMSAGSAPIAIRTPISVVRRLVA